MSLRLQQNQSSAPSRIIWFSVSGVDTSPVPVSFGVLNSIAAMNLSETMAGGSATSFDRTIVKRRRSALSGE